MMQIVIHGRGGGGGVTLAKLIAGAFFLRDRYVQAFGVYGAERSGAPVQAYVRVDDEEITLHGPISEPDHVVIIDPSLVSPDSACCMKADGWVVINSPERPSRFAADFPGRRIATIDASAIALANHLGSTTLPIVNTTVLGAVAKVLGLDFADVEAALALAKFGGPNLTAARAAFEGVRTRAAEGNPAASPPPATPLPVGFFDAAAGSPPSIHTGEWASRRPSSRELAAVCSDACPAGNDVRRFLDLAAKQEYDAALETVLASSPFPGVCGRVCPAPCMSACNRSLLDEAVNVREVERAIAARGVLPAVVARPARPERVAVLGSGPAGLTAAYHLALAGFPVTVFESASEAGGVLRTGIPAYRLPRSVLDHEIASIERHGVEIETCHPVGAAELARLCREYEAVVIATGRRLQQELDLGSAAGGAIMQGLDFLERARRDQSGLQAQRVVVIGGGNTAMDTARTALRAGAESIRVVYRRSRAEMPAIAEEIEEALEEGVAVEELLAPQALAVSDGTLVMACRRMALGDRDESGRRRPVPLDGDDAVLELECDTVLLALGQSPDLSLLPAGSAPSDRRPVDGLGPALVLAAGDFVTGAGTVAAAIGSGAQAATSVISALTGVSADAADTAPQAGPDEVALPRFPRVPQHKSLLLAASERRRSFAEVRLGLVDPVGADTAAEEASRCLSCGWCNACGTCVAYCPEGVVRHDELTGACTFDYDYCKGCGFCAAECPRGAVTMVTDCTGVRS
jgi:2-oxoacid:acceptor oxidoreductase gamma subunit (pyruvate/2-ketoisovalerate family)